ncbi:MAG: glycosyltransferase [Acidimicrobiia bacterium]|nr:glycosyltransferase [Acidimicrobiia bacterium]
MARYSILTPVYDPPEDVLRACLESVARQTFQDWEHCLVDDASTQPHVARVLEEYAAKDRRFKVKRRAANGGIIAASQDALELATGEFVCLLDHDDLLTKDALTEVDLIASTDPSLDYCYSDEDYLSPDGKFINPFHKPDWSPERFRSQMYTGHFSVARRDLVIEVGGFRTGYEGSQDYDLVLRVTEKARSIRHVAKILYHWRMMPESVAQNAEAKPWAYEAGRRAVQDHCDRTGRNATVVDGVVPGVYRVQREIEGEPLVSVVIPTRASSARVWGVERCFVVEAVRSLVERARYTNLEIIVVMDAPAPAGVIEKLERLAGERLKIVWYDKPFNFSEKVNLGAAHATAGLMLVLNDDIEVETPDFIETMIGLIQEGDVAMVGAKLLFADGRLQHAGHLYNHDPFHAYFGYPADHLGESSVLACQRETSGVTAACALVKMSIWNEVGGLTPELAANFNDVDLSLKIRAKGYRILWTPYAVLYHFESMTRIPTVNKRELEIMRERWATPLKNDPYHNPNFEPLRDDWVLRSR